LSRWPRYSGSRRCRVATVHRLAHLALGCASCPPQSLKDRAALECWPDKGDNVKEAAIDGLAVSGHGADAVYVQALAAGGYGCARRRRR
jgi:hypothetical protein